MASWYHTSMSNAAGSPPGRQVGKRQNPGDNDVVLKPELQHQLLEYARASWPEEACGLLLGRGDRVDELARLRNCSGSPQEHYALDPLDYMHAEQQCENRGLTVLGIWHSHPDSAGVPSVTDERDAWPGWLYIIVGRPRGEAPDVRGWRLDGGRFRQAVLRFAANDDTAPGSR